MTAPFSAPHFAISLYCSDFRNPAPQVEYLNTVADSYHVDIMDGHFSPSMGLCTSWIEQMLPLSTLRNEVHMMVTDPDHWIDQLVVAGATMLTPHVESLGAHAFRTLRIIHENGCGAGVAINPLTPFADVENLLERIDLITVMTVEIGYSGEPLIPEILKKIERLARFRDEQGLNYEIQIDGSCNEKNFKAMREAGANTFVLGNTGIFKRSPISARPGASPWTPTNTPPARPRPTLADFSSQSPSKPSAQLENTPSTPSPGLPSPRRAVSEADRRSNQPTGISACRNPTLKKASS